MVQNQIMIASEMKHLKRVREFILKSIREANSPPENENRIILAVDEAVANIIEHGYQFKKQGSIKIGVKIDNEKLQVSINDRGRRFNPAMVEKPNIMEWIKRGRKKGLGVFLIKQVMDEVKYIHKTGQNQLLLVKYVNQKPYRKVKGV